MLEEEVSESGMATDVQLQLSNDAGLSLRWLAAPLMCLRVPKNSPKDFIWKSRKGPQRMSAADQLGHLNTPAFHTDHTA